MGGTLRNTEINGFQHTFTVTCSVATRPEMLALWQIRSRSHGAAEYMLGIAEYYLVGLGCKNSMRLQGLWGKVPKALHKVSTRFCKSYEAA